MFASRAFWVFFALFGIYTHQGCGGGEDTITDAPPVTTAAPATPAPTAAAIASATPAPTAAATPAPTAAATPAPTDADMSTGYGYGYMA
jgi:hypothetical protein